MTAFRFRRLSEKFLCEILDDVNQGRFVILLGPPYSGKTLLLQVLSKVFAGELAEDAAAWIKDTDLLETAKLHAGRPTIDFRFQTEAPTRNEEELRKVVRAAVSTAFPQSLPDISTDCLTSAIRSLPASTTRPTVVIARSIDGLSYHLCRRLLTELDELWREGRIVPIVSGEFGLLDLVSGDTSTLTQPTLYMNQGFDSDSFRIVTGRYMRMAAGLGLKLPASVHDVLYAQTRGNDSLVGWIFWALLERAMTGVRSTDKPLPGEAIEKVAQEIATKGVRAAHTFIRADWLLSRRPECWDDLERLQSFDGLPISDETPPGPLEFSGLAVREHGRLVPANPMTKTFLATHYTPLHLADLAARSGDWSAAFERYGQLGVIEPRPKDVVDWREAASNMSAFILYLRTLDNSLQDLVTTFVDGCRYLLGLREVLYFERRDFEAWQLHPWSSGATQDAAEAALALLPRGDCQPGQYEPAVNSSCVLSWVMPGERDERQVLVMIADGIASGRVISHERRKLAKQLLQGFAEAHSRVTRLDKQVAVSTLQKQYSKVFGELIQELASKGKTLSIRELVVSCALKLKALRYRRVMISLVSPEGTRIQGFHDECDQASVRVDRLTDWDLSLPSRDLQPWVVANQRSVRVPDASQEPMANQHVISIAKMKALAIIPIILTDGTSTSVLGTIHIERPDGFLPSASEVKSLEMFGSQFANILQLQERLIQLEAAVECNQLPTVLSNSRLEACYLNESAAHLLGIQGWRGVRPESTAIEQKEMKDHLLAACTGKERKQRWMPGRHVSPYTVTTRSIMDRHQRTIGALAYFQKSDLNPEAMRVLGRVASVCSVDRAFAEALRFARSIDRKWARVWQLDPKDLTRLYFHSGYPDQNSDSLSDVELERRGARSFETWECLEKRRPIIFRLEPEKLTGGESLSAGGAPYTVLATSACPSPLAKAPGDYWIDVPLLSNKTKSGLGKLTMHWEENDPVELYELAACLVDVFGSRC